MKIFKNKSKSGYDHYSTSFYTRDEGGNVLKLPVFVNFKKGDEPEDSSEYDFDLKAFVNGREYEVIMKATDFNGQVTGVFVLADHFRRPDLKPQNSDFVPQTYAEYKAEGEPEKSEQLDLSSEALPFY